MGLEVIGLKGIFEGADKYIRDLERAERAEKGVGDAAKQLARDVDRTADQMDDAGKRAAQSWENAERWLKRASLVATGAFVAGFGLAIKTAIDFERQLDQVGAVAGATELEVAALGETAKQIGAETAFSAGDAARAMEELAAGGRSVTQILEGEARAAVDLAAAGNYGLAESARTIATTMDIWKDTQIETNDVVNRLAAAANISRFGVDDMAQAIVQGGGAAMTAGVEFQDFATAVAATASSFSSGLDAGTSFKTFVLGLSGNSKEAREAIADLGLEFFTAQGALKPMAEIVGELNEALKDLPEQQQTVYLKQIFGNDAFRTAASLMKLTKDEFVLLSDQMGKSDAADIAAQRMGNTAGSIEELKGSLETLAITLGTEFLPMLTNAVELGTDLTNVFAALDTNTQQATLAIVGMTFAVGKFNPAAGIGIGIVGALTIAVDRLMKKAGSGEGILEEVFGSSIDNKQLADEWDALVIAAGAGATAAQVGGMRAAEINEQWAASVKKVKDEANSLAGEINNVIFFGIVEKGQLKDVTDENISRVKHLAEQMVAAGASTLELLTVYKTLNPELRRAFESVTHVNESIANQEAIFAASGGQLGQWEAELTAAAAAQKAVEEAAATGTSAIASWVLSVMDAKSGTADLNKEIDVLIGNFSEMNPAAATLRAENAFLAEELGDLKAKTGELSQEEADRIVLLEETIEKNSALIEGYDQNQKALEGAKQALVNYIGEGGLGSLLAAMDAAKRPQEEQIDILRNTSSAYQTLTSGDIPGAITAFQNLKTEIDNPEEWAAIAEAIGPGLVDGIETGISDPYEAARVILAVTALVGNSASPDVLAAARAAGLLLANSIARGVAEGISSPSNVPHAEIAAFVNNVENAMYGEIEGGSPSERFAREIGEPIAEGIALGLLRNQDVIERAIAHTIAMIESHPMITGLQARLAVLTSLSEQNMEKLAAVWSSGGGAAFGVSNGAASDWERRVRLENAASAIGSPEQLRKEIAEKHPFFNENQVQDAVDKAAREYTAAIFGVSPEEVAAWEQRVNKENGLDITPGGQSRTNPVLHGGAAAGRTFNGEEVLEGTFDPTSGLWFTNGGWDSNRPGGPDVGMEILAGLAAQGDADAAARLAAAIESNAGPLTNLSPWDVRGIPQPMGHQQWASQFQQMGQEPISTMPMPFESTGGSPSFSVFFDLSGGSFGSDVHSNGEEFERRVRRVLSDENGRGAFLAGVGATLRRREV